MINYFKINIAFYLMKQFLKIAKTKKGTTAIGGLITLVILSLGVNIFRLRVDLDTCLAIKMIARSRDRFCLIFKNSSQTLSLPNTQHTSVRNQSNWILMTSTRARDDILTPLTSKPSPEQSHKGGPSSLIERLYRCSCGF